MKIKQTITMLLCVLGVLSSQSQNSIIDYTNAFQIDEDKRYEEIKGSPYFFDDFLEGIITDKRGAEYPLSQINYNGQENSFEIRRLGFFIILEDSWVETVKVFPNGKNIDKRTQLFVRNYFPTIKGKYVIVLYEKENMSFFKEVNVRRKIVSSDVPGEEKTSMKFDRQTKYHLYENNELKTIKPKKKHLLSILNHSKEVEQFLKKEKIKATKEEDLIKLMEYYGTL